MFHHNWHDLNLRLIDCHYEQLTQALYQIADEC